MSEPSPPSIIEAQAIAYGAIAPKKPISRSQPCLRLVGGIIKSTHFDCVAPIAVGSFCDFPFSIGLDSWVDPDTGLHYFKPCGRTFGSLKSQADFAFDGFKALFFVLHRNQYLRLYDSSLYEIAKTTAAADWDAKCCLALPLAEGTCAVTAGSHENFTWDVGMRGGTSEYALKLPHHNHDLLQLPHAHVFSQKPHFHLLLGQTYDKNASESSSGSGSAYNPGDGKTIPEEVNIQLENTLTNVQLMASGTISDKLKIQNRGVGMQKMIFTGAIA